MPPTYQRTGGITTPPDPLTYPQRQALRDANQPRPRGLGDLIEAAVKPLAKALHSRCLDAAGGLKPESRCGRWREALNRAAPFRVN
jgi:hypothetical protein